MGAGRPKQHLPLAGRSLLAHSLERLRHPRVRGGVVVLRPGDAEGERLARERGLLTAPGGAERCCSVLAGLRRLEGLAGPADRVLVHDAARPCLPRADLERLLAAAGEDPAGGLLALPVADTLKRAAGERVRETVDRRGLWRALTPQLFPYGLLREALEACHAEGRDHGGITDEASAVEALGRAPLLVEGSPANIKVTTPADLALAEALLGWLAAQGAL
ncbi:MAG: 2-C-methyl-D-erythritol 4-phosphate cytidylyltransferase [Gammaproteobacteria bacterium]|nr:MAG: 2-C-methyl-D-erythritol 4-phosphate cytidylyltransferase [Gammaproteobacteria bacterium]